MPLVDLTDAQKAQIIGWLHREKDYLLSIKSMAERVLTPRTTGTLELARNDYDFVVRLLDAIYHREGPVELSDSDCETLDDIAQANPYPDRAMFWRGVSDAVTEHLHKDARDES